MFTLIDLPYAQDGLEPVISARTLEFHHGKHLQGYVDNLNKLIAGTEYESMSLEEIVAEASRPVPEPVEGPAQPAIFNNAGQILNHNLYFTQFRGSALRQAQGPTGAPHSGLDPESPLGKQLEAQWGTLEAFQKEFVAKGVGLFGSGWVWLQADAAGTLSIGQYPGADNPVAHRSVPELVEGPTGRLRPLLTFDVWEHAYYLDYQNRRAAHLEALWGIVDWSVIEERYNH
ncbi:MAG: superoxide dismutase [Bacteroidales bacterium]|nr:superoxide dismutase [Bacteroidales bacterium]